MNNTVSASYNPTVIVSPAPVSLTGTIKVDCLEQHRTPYESRMESISVQLSRLDAAMINLRSRLSIARIPVGAEQVDTPTVKTEGCALLDSLAAIKRAIEEKAESIERLNQEIVF